MNASEKLVKLIDDNELNDEQLDNLSDWGINNVSELEYYLIDKIRELQNETDSIDYEEAIMALNELLNYSNDDYVVYGEDGVTELDFDVLNDVLYPD